MIFRFINTLIIIIIKYAIKQEEEDTSKTLSRLEYRNTRFSLWRSVVQFSSVQFKIISMRSEKPIGAPRRLSEVSQRRFSNGFNVRLINDGPLPSFQGRSSSASSFQASLPLVSDAV